MVGVKPGPLLADARRRAGLTQAELADRLGISQSAVAKLEREDANPTVRTLERALRATGNRIEARPVLPNVDETLIRAELAVPPAERIRRLERRAAEVGRFVASGARARGERV
jgi:transcriptional regulator with XRE-family HTH domain